jgi:hypothetical protein
MRVCDQSSRSAVTALTRAAAVPQPVLDAVETGEVLVVHPCVQSRVRPVDLPVRIAEGVVRRAESLILQMCRQPGRTRTGEIAAVDRVPQFPGQRHHVVEPGTDPLLVADRRRDQVVLSDRRRRRTAAPLGDADRGARDRVGIVRQALEGVRTLSQPHGQLPCRAGSKALHLAVHRVARGVFEVHLGGPGGGVVQIEDLQAGPRLVPAAAAAARRHLHGGVRQCVGGDVRLARPAP